MLCVVQLTAERLITYRYIGGQCEHQLASTADLIPIQRHYTAMSVNYCHSADSCVDSCAVCLIFIRDSHSPYWHSCMGSHFSVMQPDSLAYTPTHSHPHYVVPGSKRGRAFVASPRRLRPQCGSISQCDPLWDSSCHWILDENLWDFLINLTISPTVAESISVGCKLGFPYAVVLHGTCYGTR